MTAGSMPMLSITSALRAMASARRCEAMAAVFASRSSLRGGELGGQRQAEQDQRAAEGDPAHHRVQQEDHRDVDRHPGHVVERERAGRAEVAAADREVAQRLHAVGAAAQRALDGAHEALRRHPVLDPGADALHDLAARGLQQGEHQHRGAGDQRQVEQGVEDAGGEHPVEHLHHVDGGGELEQVHRAAEQRRPARTACGRPAARGGAACRRRCRSWAARRSGFRTSVSASQQAGGGRPDFRVRPSQRTGRRRARARPGWLITSPTKPGGGRSRPRCSATASCRICST